MSRNRVVSAPGVTRSEREALLEQILERLLEDAVEMHWDEMKGRHGGDADRRGVAPEACIYCQTFVQVAELLDINLKARLRGSRV